MALELETATLEGTWSALNLLAQLSQTACQHPPKLATAWLAWPAG